MILTNIIKMVNDLFSFDQQFDESTNCGYKFCKRDQFSFLKRIAPSMVSL